MTTAPIRVLLVDDSALVRAILREVLQQEGDIVVVGEATNGLEAVDKAHQLEPHIITMDLEMPVMGGMEAISTIMCSKAVPILVVSGVADAHQAFEAVKRGALDVVSKPNSNSASAAAFVTKVRMLAGISVITHIRPQSEAGADNKTAAPVPPAATTAANTPSTALSASRKVFAIASSTGGPQILATILSNLPATFPCPVLVAQHIAEGFAAGMVRWLAGMCQITIKLAEDGEKIKPATVYIAPPEYHCTVTTTRNIRFVERSAHELYHPSCDKLLQSVADVYQNNAIGIILTGMGHDGNVGMAHIQSQGGITLAQDAASSLIYGMNRCAVEAGNVQKQLADSDLAAEMLRIAKVQQ